MQGDFREMKRAVSLSLTVDVHEFLASKLEDETVVQSEAFFFFYVWSKVSSQAYVTIKLFCYVRISGEAFHVISHRLNFISQYILFKLLGK